MSVCYYCNGKTRADAATEIEVEGWVMCAGCAKRRGDVSHDVFVGLVRFEVEQQAIRIQELRERLSGAKPAPKPKPKPSVVDNDKVKKAAAAALAAWDDAPKKADAVYPVEYKDPESGVQYWFKDPDKMSDGEISELVHGHPLLDMDGPYFNERVYNIWVRLE